MDGGQNKQIFRQEFIEKNFNKHLLFIFIVI